MATLYECVRLDLASGESQLSKGNLSLEEASRRASKMNAMYNRNKLDAYMLVRPMETTNVPQIVL